MIQTETSRHQRRVEGLTRDEACQRFQRKVQILAKQVFARSRGLIPLEDLDGWGTVGLLEAFDRFDGMRGIAFTTFAEYRIRGAMRDALRSADPFSRHRRDIAGRLAATRSAIAITLGREPTPRELASKLELTLERYWKTMAQAAPVKHVGFEETTPSGVSLSETLPTRRRGTGELLQARELRVRLIEEVANLPDKERTIIRLHYAKEMTVKDIAVIHGVTGSRISQILSRARARLRKRLVSTYLPSEAMTLAA